MVIVGTLNALAINSARNTLNQAGAIFEVSGETAEAIEDINTLLNVLEVANLAVAAYGGIQIIGSVTTKLAANLPRAIEAIKKISPGKAVQMRLGFQRRLSIGNATRYKGDTIEVVKQEVALVTKNRAAGNAFRDDLAEQLRKAGRDVETEVYYWTPFGKRFIDIEVSMNGTILGGIETKVGLSRYTTLQRLKDWWIKMNHDGYIVNVARQP